MVVILGVSADRAEVTLQRIPSMHYLANRKESVDPFQNKDVSKGVFKTEGFEESPVNLMGRCNAPGGDDVVSEILCVSEVVNEMRNGSGDTGVLDE